MIQKTTRRLKAAGAKAYAGAALAAAALALVAAAPAQAATASSNFNVNITLTPKCEITTAPGSLALSYQSWQSTTSTGSTSFGLRCTNGQAYTVGLDSNSLTDGTTGLAYTLKLSSNATPGVSESDSLGPTGNGSTGQTFYVHGTIAANLEGTKTPGTANNVRQLTITY